MHESIDAAHRRFRDIPPTGSGSDSWTLRIVRQDDETLAVRRDVAEPGRRAVDLGAMVTVARGGGVGYAATSDMGDDGLRGAYERAAQWALHATRRGTENAELPQPRSGEYRSPIARAWVTQPYAEKVDRLISLSQSMGGDARIADRSASLWWTRVESSISGSAGGLVSQVFDYLVPMAAVTASDENDTQTRTFGGHAYARQGGLEVLDEVDFWSCGSRLREQALELLAAPNCPSGSLPLVLAPDQMILQIHESIGHPLELDRILGDERNYAGGSFVTPDMFGSYRYGSAQLNITFDPTCDGELASYAYDDAGQAAEPVALIRDGVLLRPLGGAVSQRRAGLPGAATARASSWNRPPIDRMANLNLEPGNADFASLLAEVDDGVYMETNRSWSIDDSRDKFQFGCEYGRRIRGGRLAEVVKNPSYRGRSATFWRSLELVGSAATLQVLGTPFCGKGEPNQIMRVGHAAPACRFRAVDVFGGE